MPFTGASQQISRCLPQVRSASGSLASGSSASGSSASGSSASGSSASGSSASGSSASGSSAWGSQQISRCLPQVRFEKNNH